MGADISARIHLQVVRRVLYPAKIPGEALSHRARAIRAAHHAKRSDAGNLPRGRLEPRWKARQGEDRAPRLRARRRARADDATAAPYRAGGNQLRSRAGGSLTAA